MRMGWAKYEASPPSYVESNRVARVARAPPPACEYPQGKRRTGTIFSYAATTLRARLYFLGRLLADFLPEPLFLGAFAATSSYDRRIRASSWLAGRTLEFASVTHLKRPT